MNGPIALSHAGLESYFCGMDVSGLAFFEQKPFSPLVLLRDEATEAAEVELWLKRDDLIDPYISGNKFRKLKYNLLEAALDPPEWLVSVGGAHSNHLYSLSFAAKRLNLPMLALIRGDEGHLDSTTVQTLEQNGTLIRAVSRSDFRAKAFSRYYADLPKALLIPEGGTTPAAIKGCAELPAEVDIAYDFLAVPCGTGGTLAGIARALAAKEAPAPIALGFAVLKGGFLEREVRLWAGEAGFRLIDGYHFGGYAKKSPALEAFMGWFEAIHGIEIEPVYSGKMLFGLYDLLGKGYFGVGSRIVAVHTGGLRV